MRQDFSFQGGCSRRRALLAALAACGGGVLAAQGAPDVRILFVGNTYMALNGLPACVGELMLSSGVLAPHIGSYLQGGHNLGQHAADPAALALLKQGADDGKPWDVLVVQEQSLLAAVAAVEPEARQIMNEGLCKLVTLALEANPKMLIVVFQVWARHASLWKKKSTDALSTGASADEAHARIRQANAEAVKAALERHPRASILIGPVGDFWRVAQDALPAMPLHAADGSHPDVPGTMLSALVIAGTIGGREVIDRSTWTGECVFADVAALKKVLLDHPKVFSQAGK